MKINTVRFGSASPIYGFSAIKVGVANVVSIELHPTLPAILVTRATGQKLMHPFSSVEVIDYEDEAEKEKPKKAVKD